MDLKQLQYFVTCAQTGSVSEAAKILYSTQPSVSKVVKALEDSLGMQLFERLPRGIRLTPQGSHKAGSHGGPRYDKMAQDFRKSKLLVRHSVCGFL